ncbi:MAG TPA: YCF48-related protein [Gemmatimonadaceae bacterium]|nr:YCF48-related protein [Gemmatimonadaceae bacterium]
MRRHVRHPFARVALLVTSVTFAPTLASGAQWHTVSSPTEVELRGLSVVSPRVVWASGMRGTVLRTTDGGRDWVRDTIPGASALDFRAIAATSNDVAHALSIGDSSRIYRTTDGGRTWSLRFVSTRKGSFFDAIQFWDAKHGIAMSDPVDGRFLIIATDDGGDTWHEMPASGMPAALPGEGGFAASGTCLIIGGDHDAWLVSGGASVARIFHTADRGRTWTVQDTPLRAGVSSAGIFSVTFRDARHGAIAGGDYQQPALRGRNLAVTSDGGATWTLADSASSPAGYRSAVAFLPKSNGRTLIAVGLTGTDVSHDGGATWSPVDPVAYNSVAFAADGSGWAVGPKGRIARWARVHHPDR